MKILLQHDLKIAQKMKWLLSSVRLFLASISLGLIFTLIALWNVGPYRVTVFKQQIKFSTNEHFFNDSASIELVAPINVPVHYTLDGSEPDLSSLKYEAEINLSQTTVLKAAMFYNQEKIGATQTFDAFINSEHSVPVISLSTHTDNLFSPDTGIYSSENKNHNKSGEEWERPVTFSYFDRNNPRVKETSGNHLLTVQKEARIRIHGGGSRSRLQKPFRILFEENNEYDPVSYPFFPNQKTEEFPVLILRSAGDNTESMMRDALMNRLAEQQTDLDTQASRVVAVYLNGEYWGFYYLRERLSSDYFQYKYGQPAENFAFVANTHELGDNRGRVVAYRGDAKDEVEKYNNLLTEYFCDSCFDYDQFKKFADIENFTDYMIFEFFGANYDWPYGNFRAWRFDTPFVETNASYGLDGRFRWLFFDLDVGLGYGSKTREKIISASKNGSYGRLEDSKFPFRSAFFDARFKADYLRRFADLLNTTLSPENMKKTIDELVLELEGEIPAHLERWGGQDGEFGREVPIDVDEWYYFVDLLKLYSESRATDMFDNSVEFFGVNGTAMLSIESESEKVNRFELNTISLENTDDSWQGKYFLGSVITIKVIPNFGEKFSHWEVIYPDGTIQVEEHQDLRFDMLGKTKLKAVFEDGWF